MAGGVNSQFSLTLPFKSYNSKNNCKSYDPDSHYCKNALYDDVPSCGADLDFMRCSSTAACENGFMQASNQSYYKECVNKSQSESE